MLSNLHSSPVLIQQSWLRLHAVIYYYYSEKLFSTAKFLLFTIYDLNLLHSSVSQNDSVQINREKTVTEHNCIGPPVYKVKTK